MVHLAGDATSASPLSVQHTPVLQSIISLCGSPWMFPARSAVCHDSGSWHPAPHGYWLGTACVSPLSSKFWGSIALGVTHRRSHSNDPTARGSHRKQCLDLYPPVPERCFPVLELPGKRLCMGTRLALRLAWASQTGMYVSIPPSASPSLPVPGLFASGCPSPPHWTCPPMQSRTELIRCLLLSSLTSTRCRPCLSSIKKEKGGAPTTDFERRPRR